MATMRCCVDRSTLNSNCVLKYGCVPPSASTSHSDSKSFCSDFPTTNYDVLMYRLFGKAFGAWRDFSKHNATHLQYSNFTNQCSMRVHERSGMRENLQQVGCCTLEYPSSVYNTGFPFLHSTNTFSSNSSLINLNAKIDNLVPLVDAKKTAQT